MQEEKNEDPLIRNENQFRDDNGSELPEDVPETQEKPEKIEMESLIKLEVPFVVQAPFGNWDNPVFQDACEEASVIMAMGWVNGVQKISPEEAEKQIEKIANFENSNFGYNANTDVFKVEKIIRDYFKHQNVAVEENISMEDIQLELQTGNVVLVPAFGQMLSNPNYTAPGPVSHMLAIIGYDPGTDEFITNDPGTRKGSNYRYDKKVLFDAIWAYPSGSEKLQAPSGSLKKTMVIVKP